MILDLFLNCRSRCCSSKKLNTSCSLSNSKILKYTTEVYNEMIGSQKIGNEEIVEENLKIN